uniref:Uncharacterized protein LOC111132400 n=1 Tax=Crassostrea virginica TaxID=6565 RepID=A0A8B8E6Y2_CRAVI|nr:uncharacterized protein LOC111132400 [Crassostrea virginica]
MLLFVFWLSFNFLNEASVSADKICWKTDDLSSKKELFIRCQKSMITLEDIEINENRLSRRCSSKLSLKNLFRCNGLKNICDVDNFETIEKFVDNCIYRSSAYAVCIIYNCVNGEPNYLLDKTILTEARGQVYKAVWFRGILHCSIYGHITNITVYKIPLTEITVRDENGSRIIDYDDKFYSRTKEDRTMEAKIFSSYSLSYYDYYHFTYPHAYELSSSVLSFTKNLMNLETIGLTIHSKTFQDVPFLVEGGINYRCDNGMEGIRLAKESLYGINDEARFRERFLWITTVLSLLLSLVLVVVYIIQCLLWQKHKRISLKTKSQTDPSSRRPIANDYETPHVYMDVAL